MVVALVALFAAVTVSGTVYAASKINGKQIKKNSVPGNRIEMHSLTGKQINPATLGIVHAAIHADTAIHADSADTATHADSATHADNSTTVGGKLPAQLATNANGVTSSTDSGALDAGGQVVLATQVVAEQAPGPIKTDIVANASLDMYSVDSMQGTAICYLSLNGARMSPDAFADFTYAGQDIQLPLVGFALVQPNDNYEIDAHCRAVGAGLYHFGSGDLFAELIPSAPFH